MADGSAATVEGILTTNLGALESARSGFVQDATGGIAIYLDGPFDIPVAAGSRIRATGSVDSRFGQRTLRVDRADVTVLGEQWLPTPLEVQTGAAAEPLEGLRLQLGGTVTEAPSALSDGLGLMIDDGSGEVRVIVGPAALDGFDPVRGSIVVARGPLGQRDSSGTGLEGYRLHATLAGELEVLPSPTPSPTATPTPSPSPSPTVEPTPTVGPTATAAPSLSPAPSPSPSAAPTASPSVSPPITIAAARLTPIGTTVFVRGVVVAEAGRLGTPPLLAIADATGGIPVRLPDGVAPPARGTLLEVRGALADPYGQVELRPPSGGIAVVGTGTPPSAIALSAGAVGEPNEGRLARVSGIIDGSASKSTSNDLTFSITGTDGATLRVLADASAGIDAGLFRKGAGVSLTGIVGQRASRKGALDGYRLWLRDRGDVVITTQPAPTPSATPRGGPTPKPSAGAPKPPLMSVRAALVHAGQRVAVEGTLTVGTSLLDASGRRTILEDTTAAIEVYLAAPDAGMRLGARVRVTGTVGEAWGAPRLRADETRVLGSRQPAVHGLQSAPTAAVEWRLVRVAGTIVEVHKSGDRWTADLQIHGGRVPIAGLAGSGIASTDLAAGRAATVTGIVKRPYPTATDRRFAIVPRRRADIVLGKAAPTAGASSSPLAGAAAGAVDPGGSPAPGAETTNGGAGEGQARDIDLRDLGAHAGERVRVGGLVVAIEAAGIRLDDGTAEALIVLGGDAAGLAGSLQPGDALNATGTPELRDEPVLVVVDIAGIELVGDLGGADPSDLGPSDEGHLDRVRRRAVGRAAPCGVCHWSRARLGVDRPRHARARRDRFGGRHAGPSRTWPPAAACPDRRPSRGPGTERPGAHRGGRTGRSEPELGPRSGHRSRAPRDPFSPDRGPNGG